MLVFGQSGRNRAKVNVFGQSGEIRANGIYIAKTGCFWAKVVVFGQKWLY